MLFARIGAVLAPTCRIGSSRLQCLLLCLYITINSCYIVAQTQQNVYNHKSTQRFCSRLEYKYLQAIPADESLRHGNA